MEGFTRFSQFLNRRLQFRSSILPRLEKPFEQPSEHPSGKVDPPPGQHLLPMLAFLVCHPLRILYLWNWKSAWLSILLRAPIFLAATAHRGLRTTLAAVLTECFFCALTAGFYGALIQNLRNAKPPWLTALFLALAVPATFQVLEAYLHWARGTPHLRIAEGASITVAVVSSLFNWYAMQQGALLVGNEGRSFRSDLRRLPRLLVSFLGRVLRDPQEHRKHTQAW
jgi:hypothetical protein